MLVAAVVGVLIFGAAAVLGVLSAELICSRIEPFADGPRPSSPRVPVIIGMLAVAGGFVALHGFAASVISIGAVAAFALAGCWYCDLARGIVPDFFTLFPLGCLCLFAASQSEWRVLISAAVPFVPFAIAAIVSRGRGMGWGDAKLVALGGAVLGAQAALLAFAISCFAAGVVSRLSGRRGTPIAFAPYLVAAVAVALAIGAYT
jgi:prepilin signal peptidase PulO-like enzyme (type II secretory pathway)